ncbi:peptidyl-prolyl cis-trans isomerase-like 3 isoform X4 [Phascolarctos cinereus]
MINFLLDCLKSTSRMLLSLLSSEDHFICLKREGFSVVLGCYQGPKQHSKSVTLHTDVGDIKIEVFCERTPKSCENFLALCASNYYNGCIFHRNIKGFMVQTGDPTGSGKGGNSIWGRKFEDEYSEYLKHSVRGVVSMANNGPNTNGSQFFITYGKQPHLDMKYTVFGKT